VDGVTQRIRLPLTPQAPRRAREWARETTALDPEVSEVMKLLVSELVANSVRHSGDATSGHVDILIRKQESRVHVEVRDTGPGTQIELGTIPDHSGLRIVDSLSHRWGVRHHPTTVWFELGS
jgi:anti-sigma regulatory factor (Ser/Thr protein kinase)